VSFFHSSFVSWLLSGVLWKEEGNVSDSDGGDSRIPLLIPPDGEAEVTRLRNPEASGLFCIKSWRYPGTDGISVSRIASQIPSSKFNGISNKRRRNFNLVIFFKVDDIRITDIRAPPASKGSTELCKQQILVKRINWLKG
jgi:hypothetical protein